jgi:serine-type D-Ala-D-Ala carboxypeptidase (penicillin-binding protein 5/6)
VFRARPPGTFALVPVLAAILVVLRGLAAPPSSAQTLEPPPPTPVPVPGGGTSPSPFPSVLRTPPPGVESPEIRAGSAILVDLETGQTLFALNPREERPIASLTKIMTAYLVMTRTGPRETLIVGENPATEQVVGISNLGLEAGEEIRVHQLLYALMLQSANDAAVAVAEHLGGGTVEGFVDMMNETAAELGMASTSFASPNGLDDSGYSSARDLARLTRAAYRIPGFAGIVATRVHAIPAPEGDARIVQNRNALLWLYPGAIGVKTGFTSAAGFCVVATAVRGNEHLLAVVLGEPGEPFSDAAALLNFGFAAFEHRPLISEGRALGTVNIDGRDVTVAAGASLEGLVPVETPVRRRIEVDPAVRFPPGRGQAIGTVVLSVPDLALGEVPLVVTNVPPPPTLQEGGSWWSRALGSVARAGSGLFGALFD